MDEETRRRYINLRNNLYTIRGKINEAINLHNNLIYTLNSSFTINNEVAYSSKINSEKTRLNNVKNDINVVINNINWKI